MNIQKRIVTHLPTLVIGTIASNRLVIQWNFPNNVFSRNVDIICLHEKNTINYNINTINFCFQRSKVFRAPSRQFLLSPWMHAKTHQRTWDFLSRGFFQFWLSNFKFIRLESSNLKIILFAIEQTISLVNFLNHEYIRFTNWFFCNNDIRIQLIYIEDINTLIKRKNHTLLIHARNSRF